MGERRTLVIGSQCKAAGRLSFLPGLAQELYAVMTDPKLGGCVPALQDGDDGALLIDPTVAKASDAIEEAFRRASEGAATLFLAFIGHGVYVDRDFYLLPYDASITPTSRTAIHLVHQIKELRRIHDKGDGLVVLCDACHSGIGAAAASAEWVGDLQGTMRFEVLTATNERTAADGCFSRNIAAVVREGIAGTPSAIRCEVVRKILAERCPNQQPQLPSYNPDDGLYLARNVAVLGEPWAGIEAVAAQVERLTLWYEPPPQLTEVVAASEDGRCVALEGVAGTGKSALAAALASPEVTEGMVPPAFVQGISFLAQGTTASSLAGQLADQLRKSVPDFADAQEEFRRHTTQDELAGLDPLQRELVGPLRCLRGDRTVRLVVDGLDQLPPMSASLVQGGLELMASDSMLGFVRLVVSSRPQTSLPAGAQKLTIGRADDKQIRAYLQRREIAPHFRDVIIARGNGNWLVARLLADLAAGGAIAKDLPKDLLTIYDHVLHQAGAAGDLDRWRKELRPVLGVLAAAGTGPILPIALLCAASAKLGGPERISPVRDILVDLRGFVVRAEPGAPDEHVGLFHQTFAEYLLDPATGEFGIEPEESHRALAETIEALAPMAAHSFRNPWHRYATAREAEHLWAIGEHARALESLKRRELPIPAENLNLWRRWNERVNAAFGPDHPNTLTTRNNIAAWTGRTGDAREALQLFEALLSDVERVLGPDYPETLAPRNNVAAWTGEIGDAREALRLFEALLPDVERVLGPDHPDMLTTRISIAVWTGRTGDAREALQLFEALLSDVERVLGPDHPDTLNTRNNIAIWAGETGDAREALRLFEALLPDVERVLGPDHPDTLTTRNNIAAWTGEIGDAREALRLCKALLPDKTRVLGPGHPSTLNTRHNIAFWTGQTGDAREALRLFEALLPDVERVLGPDHPETLAPRNNIAAWTGETGDAREALRLFEALLPDVERVLGPDHPDMLTTRHNIAAWTGETGDAREALRLCKALLPDKTRVLGPDHPDTLNTRNTIAFWTGQTGDAREALRLFEALLPDVERVLGPDHPYTLATRSRIKHWQCQAPQ